MTQKKDSYAGQILYINLSSGKVSFEPTKKYIGFLGGRGIDQWLLYKNVRRETQPLDPENIISFSTGVLSGTLAPAAGRVSVVSKNYVTGGVGHSNVGGKFGPELKYAGYDHVVIVGRAARPVYVRINDDNVEIVDAKEIWGLTTWETEDIIKERIGDLRVQIASIGQGGENLVKAGCIIFNRTRSASRCGLGSVMGSKKLKAIAVRGTGSVEVAFPEKFAELVDKFWEKVDKVGFVKVLREQGQPNSWLPAMNDLGMMAPRNFQDVSVDRQKLKELMDGYGYNDKYELGRVACAVCPIFCSHLFQVNKGPYAGVKSEGFEACLPVDLGSKLDICYSPFLLKAQELCSQYGLDTNTIGGSIAWAFECFEKKLLSRDDTDGLELRWGDYETVEKIIKKIALREGKLGDLLAEGSKMASEGIGRGTEKYAMHIKGADFFEPLRVAKGYALGTVVASRGAGHLDGAPGCELGGFTPEDCEKIFGASTGTDPTEYAGKGKIVAYHEKFKAVIDCLGVCYSFSEYTSPDMPSIQDYTEILNAAADLNMTTPELLKIGERVNNVGKAFNTLHAGFTRKDDYPPARFFDEPAGSLLPSGPWKGESLNRVKWDQMLDEYYEANGWDKNGLQTREALEKLNLAKVISDLEKAGFL